MSPWLNPRRRALILGVCLVVGALALGGEALAQARNPFNVGITEGGGQGTGLVGWIIAKQIEMERGLSAATSSASRPGSSRPRRG